MMLHDPAQPDRKIRTPVRREAAREGGDHLRKLTDALKENLRKCAHDPDVDAVHDTRTGTRRIEAVLEAELWNAGADSGNEQDELAKAARGWERLLKRVRRAAAPVRDLDVQRKLLKTLAPAAGSGTPDAPQSGMAEQADRLDGALKGEREHHAASLKKNAAKWAEKLEEHFAAYTAVRRQARSKRRRDAAKTALDAFARLADHMRLLDAGNLHDFRKGAKKARYMAEQGGDEARAQMVGKALRKLQDEIGDWHDWLMLADEAHKYLVDDGAVLTAEIERKRDLHFELAMEVERRMRGRLIGEGLAGTARPGARRTGTRAVGAKAATIAKKA